MRVSEKLKWIFLRNVCTADAKLFLVPRPREVFAGKLVAYMGKSIARARLYSRVAGSKERLQGARIIVIVGGHKVKLVRWSITHDRRKEIIGQRKLLRPTPQGAHSGGGIVIVPHGHNSVKKG